MKYLKGLFLILSLSIVAACGGGGGGSAGPSNVGGGYTLLASGGTLNDGSGTNGLAVLVSLRDADGIGPGLTGNWTITISGPGLIQPLTVDYDDASSGSYSTWWWEGLNPASGTYTATATNGATTLTYSFNINSTTIPKPAVSGGGSTVSWGAVAGAGSYYYSVTDGTGYTVASGYIAATSDTVYSFNLPTLSDGSYLVEVIAHTQNRIDLGNNASASPSLVAQDNISLGTIDLVMSNGSAGSYLLKAKGGVLYMGQDGGVNKFGLAIWSSILTDTGSRPAGDWTVTVTGPNITTPISFTYPRTNAQYLYWEFGTAPAAGIYTVTATTPGFPNQITTTFDIADIAATLPVAGNIKVSSGSTGYAITWNPITGAKSYYVNLWAMVGGEYTEVANGWVTGTTSTIPKAKLVKGTVYDVYITAASEDMTVTNAVASPLPVQVNMSDNTFSAVSFTAQ